VGPEGRGQLSQTLISDGPAGAPAPAGRRRRVSFAWLGLAPFFVYVAVFLLWPTLAVFWKAAHDKAGNFSLSTYGQIMSTQQLRKSFWNSTLLSLDSAVSGAVIGLLLAYALVSLRRPRWLRNAVTSFSAVAANMGGLPLVFFFVAAIGVKGMLTRFLVQHDVHLYNSQFIYNNPLRSLTIIYLYFQIPLMVIVMLPAIDGLKSSWREAATNLGASRFQYWRRVGMPVLWPAFLGGLVLLFANSFAAYATAYVLSGGQTNLASIQIGFFLQGNTIADSEQIGYAIAAWMILVVFVAIMLYQWLRSRTAKWQQ
jgi:putative spermidine/putrescine transport system permease protein